MFTRLRTWRPAPAVAGGPAGGRRGPAGARTGRRLPGVGRRSRGGWPGTRGRLRAQPFEHFVRQGERTWEVACAVGSGGCDGGTGSPALPRIPESQGGDVVGGGGETWWGRRCPRPAGEGPPPASSRVRQERGRRAGPELGLWEAPAGSARGCDNGSGSRHYRARAPLGFLPSRNDGVGSAGERDGGGPLRVPSGQAATGSGRTDLGSACAVGSGGCDGGRPAPRSSGFLPSQE